MISLKGLRIYRNITDLFQMAGRNMQVVKREFFTMKTSLKRLVNITDP